MSVSVTSRVGPIAVADQGDTFVNKVGDWAFRAPAPSLYTEQQELQGRFSITPPDGEVMNYLEERVAERSDLPVGHRYDQALRQAIAHTANNPQVQAILLADLEIRELFTARRMEQVFS